MDLEHAAAEVHIDEELVRALLSDQHPDLAEEPLTWVDEGWDNVTYRVGPGHAVRIPRRQSAVELLLAEQRWLPVIAPRLPVAVPRPVGLGVASDRFPWPWSVVEWIPGETVDLQPMTEGQAGSLANVLQALHRPAPAELPFNPFRGVPLEARKVAVEERLERLALNELIPIWQAAIAAPPAREKTWIHGDLHPRNVLVRDGILAGLIDWGDMTGGDVATDLACAWMLLDATARSSFLAVYDPPGAVLERAAGWAVNFASALLDSGDSRHVRIGRAVRRRLAGSDPARE